MASLHLSFCSAHLLLFLSAWVVPTPAFGAPPRKTTPAIVTSSVPATIPAGAGNAPAIDGGATPGRLSLRVTTTALRPKIDGLLDDQCWQDAAVIRDLTQVEPTEGAHPTEQTEVRLVHDRDHLCIGVRCYDREPGKIIAKQMQRDADMESDDMITLTFDTFGRKRTGYRFSISAGGAIQDALLEADGAQRTGWDTVWHGRARLDDKGWTAEIEIPFKSLSFDERSSSWGFNFERVIRRKQESVRWSAPYQNKSVTSLADLGELRELSGIRKGLGLEFKPFLVTRFAEERNGRRGFDFEPGFDLFYGITPSLTASLTVNTDFAETDVDERQVNLTRFPLFFPEKRDFFLQDANLFSFGAYNGPLAFHSRRIGLGPAGETVDILAGGKVTGRIGNLDLGLLDVQVDDTAGVPSKNLGVARASYRILEESAIGGIFTYGNPRGTGDNYLGGLDFNYRNSHFGGKNVLKAQSWILKSDSTGEDGRQMAFGGSIRYPNEPVSAEISASQIDPDFNPALGFVRQRGIRQYAGKLGYRWRPGKGYIRSWGIQVEPFYVTNLDGGIETETVTLPGVDFLNEAGDSLSMGFTTNRENFADGFEISPGITVPGDDYRFNRFYALVATTSARPFSAFASLYTGKFYDGHSDDFGAGVEWRPNARSYFSAQGTLSQISLPGGSFDVIIGQARANFSFSPSVSWNTVLQYDNVSETLGVNSRLKWIVRSGSNIFFVVNYGFDAENGRFETLSNEITTKIGWTFRF